MRPVHGADNFTTFMCQFIWKSGSLDLLETSGPVQACTGIALSYFVHTFVLFYALSVNRRQACLQETLMNLKHFGL
jgi:hypothetical protein